MRQARLPIRPRTRKPELRPGIILDWADEFYKNRERWPNVHDGVVAGTADQTWSAIDRALGAGLRGLPGGDTLAKLLLRCRGRRHERLPPHLTVQQVLGWADAHHRKTGKWPGGHTKGQIPGAPKGTTWVAIQLAFARGSRGLPAGTTIPKLLEQHRGGRHRKSLPPLTEAQILTWAEDHNARTGRWPKHKSGPVTAAPGETWLAVEAALSKGHRGLPGGDSLAQLLARKRGVRNRRGLQRLSASKIRTWARAHKKRTGEWPHVHDGALKESPDDTWLGINVALANGARGLPGGTTLFQFLHGRAPVGGR